MKTSHNAPELYTNTDHAHHIFDIIVGHPKRDQMFVQ